MIDLAVSLMQTRLKELAYLDLVGGVARPQRIVIEDRVRVFPATPDPDAVDGYLWLTPNTERSGIAYFEVLQNRKTGSVYGGRGYNFEATARLIVWLNMKRITPATAAPEAMAAIVSKLQGGYSDALPVSNLIVTPEAEAIRGPELFAKYTYDEHETQHLMLLFEYFAFDFTMSFVMQSNCPAFNIVAGAAQC